MSCLFFAYLNCFNRIDVSSSFSLLKQLSITITDCSFNICLQSNFSFLIRLIWRKRTLINFNVFDHSRWNQNMGKPGYFLPVLISFSSVRLFFWDNLDRISRISSLGWHFEAFHVTAFVSVNQNKLNFIGPVRLFIWADDTTQVKK